MLREVYYCQGIILDAMKSNEPSKLNQVLTDHLALMNH